MLVFIRQARVFLSKLCLLTFLRSQVWDFYSGSAKIFWADLTLSLMPDGWNFNLALSSLPSLILLLLWAWLLPHHLPHTDLHTSPYTSRHVYHLCYICKLYALQTGFKCWPCELPLCLSLGVLLVVFFRIRWNIYCHCSFTGISS